MKERNRVIKAAKDRETAVIVSSHDFLKTPPPPLQNMRTIIEEMFLAGADIAKLAVMPPLSVEIPLTC